MNNGESIKKYNDLLIKFLNDLVNSIEDNNKNDLFFSDIANRLKQGLNTYSLDIADQGVKTMMANAFKEYSNILKKHFDSSNIHRIDLNHDDENITNEMNQITANLTNAVTNMNKIPDYADLINRIKSTLKGYFNQTFPSYQSIEFEIEQILNEVIVGSFNTFTSRKIEDFTRDILPELYTIADSITYDTTTHVAAADENTNVNDERDAFISETMDIDIEEGFENGVVTLKVVDPMGNTAMYYGTEAMEKLTSYNQLFESSRPGKKADTSNWAFDTSSRKQNLVNDNPVNNIVSNENNTSNNTSNNINNIDTTNNNEALIKDFFSNYDNTLTNNTSNDPVNEFNNLTNEEFGNLASTVNNVENTTNTDYNNLVNSVNSDSNSDFGNFNDPSSIMNYFNNEDKDKSSNNDDVVFGDLTSPSTQNNNEFSNLNNLENNPVDSTLNDNSDTTSTSDSNISNTGSEDDLKQVKEMMGFNEDNNSSSFSGSFSFLPEYDNPNEERDEFIKKATGIEIDEDTDNQGQLYLKVVEPTGREQIYTGKEAVRMIRNFNKTYLDANPDKKVDTTLIDNFKE